MKKGVTTEIDFDASKMKHEIKIDINDDKLIEPFEFFTVDIISVSPQEFIPKVLKKIVYIEDNDCKIK